MASLYLTSKVGRVLLSARVGFGSGVAFLNCDGIIGFDWGVGRYRGLGGRAIRWIRGWLLGVQLCTRIGFVVGEGSVVIGDGFFSISKDWVAAMVGRRLRCWLGHRQGLVFVFLSWAWSMTAVEVVGGGR